MSWLAEDRYRIRFIEDDCAAERAMAALDEAKRLGYQLEREPWRFCGVVILQFVRARRFDREQDAREWLGSERAEEEADSEG